MPVTLGLFRDETDFKIFSAGATVFEEGDEGDAMYVVLEGKVELRIGDKRVDTLGPGEIFGEMALIDSTPRIASAVAKTLCKLVPVSQQRFLSLIQRTPDFSLQIMRVMAGRLRKMNTRL
jgi:CRP/FNR family cyclic AMP-dependent transcriptional regulator